TSKLEPPALINGNALPAKGNKFTITDMLINASIEIQSVRPAASNIPK
ncbi:unnamed protein product, partial [marine sediment metagenome]